MLPKYVRKCLALIWLMVSGGLFHRRWLQELRQNVMAADKVHNVRNFS